MRDSDGWPPRPALGFRRVTQGSRMARRRSCRPAARRRFGVSVWLVLPDGSPRRASGRAAPGASDDARVVLRAHHAATHPAVFLHRTEVQRRRQRTGGVRARLLSEPRRLLVDGAAIPQGFKGPAVRLQLSVVRLGGPQRPAAGPIRRTRLRGEQHRPGLPGSPFAGRPGVPGVLALPQRPTAGGPLHHHRHPAQRREVAWADPGQGGQGTPRG